MRVLLCASALAAGLLAGCGDDDSVARAGEPDAGRPGAVSGGRDAALGPDGAQPRPDAAISSDAGDAPCPSSSASSGADVPALGLELPREPRPGTPFVVAIRAAQAWSGEAVLCLDARAVARARLHRGRGSVSLTIAQPGPVQLAVHAGGAVVERALELRERTFRALSGALAGAELQWTRDADVQLSGDVRVPAGARLEVGAGTRVLLAPRAALEVAGELEVAGSDDDPVSFTRAGDAPWGGIRVLPGGNARLQHAWLSAGGGDPTRAFGHSDSQPVLWADGATVLFEGGGIVDSPGKALGASAARLTVRGALISRCDTGGQLATSVLELRDSHLLEIPDADGAFDDDDNDGIYLLGAMTDTDGAPLASTIADSVFALGEDDAIDHNDAELRIERVWIEHFRHEGVAASAGRRVVISDSVVRGCAQGIEAGYGSPRVEVEHCLLTDNGVGLRLGDEYEWDTSGSLSVRHSIAYANRDQNALNFVEQLNGPLAGALTITCSLVDQPEYDTMPDNVSSKPSGDLRTGCATGPSTLAPECDGAVLGPRSCW